MRASLVSLVLAAAVIAAPAAMAADAPTGRGTPAPAAPQTPPAPPPRAGGGAAAPAVPPAAAEKPADLNTLFAQLKDATTDDGAKTTATRINAMLLKSGSDTVDLLMAWALQAMQKKDWAGALDILDRVTILKPDYAEGWNKRATVYYSQDDYGKSLIDIQHVLALEPRHFGALSGLGLIMRELGKNDLAIAAFKKALEIYPRLDDAKKALEDLEKETGRDI